MFDDEPLAVARLLRAAERSLVVIDRAHLAGSPAVSDLDINAMASGDWPSWARWATLVRRLRAETERMWLPIVLRWFESPPLVFTNLIGREPIRAGALPHLYVETHGSLERLVCTAACGAAPVSIANDDLDVSARRLIPRFGRCKQCKSPVVPSASQAHCLSGDVQFANDQTLDAWRAAPGNAAALVLAREGAFRTQGLRLAQAANAKIATLPDGVEVEQWVKHIDHAAVSLTWGTPGAISVRL